MQKTASLQDVEYQYARLVATIKVSNEEDAKAKLESAGARIRESGAEDGVSFSVNLDSSWQGKSATILKKYLKQVFGKPTYEVLTYTVAFFFSVTFDEVSAKGDSRKLDIIFDTYNDKKGQDKYIIFPEENGALIEVLPDEDFDGNFSTQTAYNNLLYVIGQQKSYKTGRNTRLDIGEDLQTKIPQTERREQSETLEEKEDYLKGNLRSYLDMLEDYTKQGLEYMTSSAVAHKDLDKSDDQIKSAVSKAARALSLASWARFRADRIEKILDKDKTDKSALFSKEKVMNLAEKLKSAKESDSEYASIIDSITNALTDPSVKGVADTGEVELSEPLKKSMLTSLGKDAKDYGTDTIVQLVTDYTVPTKHKQENITRLVDPTKQEEAYMKSMEQTLKYVNADVPPFMLPRISDAETKEQYKALVDEYDVAFDEIREQKAHMERVKESPEYTDEDKQKAEYKKYVDFLKGYSLTPDMVDAKLDKWEEEYKKEKAQPFKPSTPGAEAKYTPIEEDDKYAFLHDIMKLTPQTLQDADKENVRSALVSTIKWLKHKYSIDEGSSYKKDIAGTKDAEQRADALYKMKELLSKLKELDLLEGADLKTLQQKEQAEVMDKLSEIAAFIDDTNQKFSNFEKINEVDDETKEDSTEDLAKTKEYISMLKGLSSSVDDRKKLAILFSELKELMSNLEYINAGETKAPEEKQEKQQVVYKTDDDDSELDHQMNPENNSKVDFGELTTRKED